MQKFPSYLLSVSVSSSLATFASFTDAVDSTVHITPLMYYSVSVCVDCIYGYTQPLALKDCHN